MNDIVLAFVIGFMLGVAAAAIVAWWIWIDLTPGNDHPHSPDEIRMRIKETYR